MITLTATQTTALEQEHQVVVKTVKIDLGTDLLYCDGVDPVTVDSEVYTPRGLTMSPLVIGEEAQASVKVELDDVDGVVGAVWVSENGFSEVSVTVNECIFSAGVFETVRTAVLECAGCQRTSDRRLILTLTGAGGTQPRGGPEEADRAVWHLAPEPGKPVRIGATTARL